MYVGFIGLGAMGSPMARNLATAGHHVQAWTRGGAGVGGVQMVASPSSLSDLTRRGCTL